MTVCITRRLGFFFALGFATAAMQGCQEDPASGEYPPGDAVMLSDNTQVTRGISGWELGPIGVTANVILATADTRSHFTVISANNAIYEGVERWEGELGPSTLTLASARQTAEAGFDGTGYSIMGLVGEAAYAEVDTFTVTAHTVGASDVTVSVAAPPPTADAADLLGEPAGLGTIVSVPDGTFDRLFVTVVASGTGPGDFGAMRQLTPAEMQLEGDLRTAPLLDEPLITALTERGLEPTRIYVAYYRELMSDVLFPGHSVPVQAGRMFQIDPADLTP